MSQIKSIALKFNGATFHRRPVKHVMDGEYHVIPCGGEVAFDLVTQGADGHDVQAGVVIAENLCYQPKFIVKSVKSPGFEGLIFGNGGTDQKPNDGYQVEQAAPDGYGIGDSRWISTRGYGGILNQLKDGFEDIVVIKASLEIEGRTIQSNSLGFKFANIKPQDRE